MRQELLAPERDFSTSSGNMHTVSIALLAVACVQAVGSSTVDGRPVAWTNGSSTDMEASVEERMKELRIEMVKFQILSKLNLKEAPPSTESPSQSLREVFRLMMKEDEERKRKQYHVFDSEERLLIHAKGSSMPCLQSNLSHCKMFRYDLNSNLNTSSMDIWIYKRTEYPKWVSISLSFSNSFEEKYYEALYYELNQVGWNKLQLPRILLPPSWNESIYYSAEIIGPNIEYHGDHRPFLMVSKLFFMPSRQRRDVNCDTNESCCLKPLRVSFAEIGFNWVLYPEELEANLCTGKCRMDHGSLRTHYERAMTKILESDATLHATLGECWSLCCKPKILEPVRVIYNDTDGIIHDQYIPELTVKSCSCF